MAQVAGSIETCTFHRNTEEVQSFANLGCHLDVLPKGLRRFLGDDFEWLRPDAQETAEDEESEEDDSIESVEDDFEWLRPDAQATAEDEESEEDDSAESVEDIEVSRYCRWCDNNEDSDSEE